MGKAQRHVSGRKRPWLVPSDEDLVLYAAYTAYLEAEYKWVGRRVAEMAGALPASLLPRLVQYSRGGRLRMWSDVESLAAAVFGGGKQDPRAWDDSSYERALDTLHSWSACELLERRVRNVLDEARARNFRNVGLRTRFVKERLTGIGLSRRAVDLVGQGDWRPNAPVSMARRVAVAELGRGDARALRRFLVLWKEARSERATRRLCASALRAYLGARWRGRVFQAADLESPNAAALSSAINGIKRSLERLRGWAVELEARLNRTSSPAAKALTTDHRST